MVVLVLGLLSTELDLFLDHAPVHADHSRCIHGRSTPQHLVPGEYETDVPPCNACFFHKLLSHGLIPSADLVATPAGSIDSLILQPLYQVESHLHREKSRSPPLS